VRIVEELMEIWPNEVCDSLSITTSSMNKEKMTLIVGNRLQDSIKSSSLVKIEDCSLLIHQSCHFIYIILLSLQERIGYFVSLSQTSFGHISINSSTILTVSEAMKRP